jgi:hypothetical protein
LQAVSEVVVVVVVELTGAAVVVAVETTGGAVVGVDVMGGVTSGLTEIVTKVGALAVRVGAVPIACRCTIDFNG